MRRPTLSFFFAALACAAFVPASPACSSNDSATTTNDTSDASIQPEQPVGAQCDPTLADACYNGNPCDTVVCDVTQDPPVCVESQNSVVCSQPVEEGGLFTSDAAADTGIVNNFIACGASSDCPTVDGAAPYVCGYSANDGCSSTGVCVIPEVPHLLDGAVEVACGCNGQPVDYVTETQTAAPAASAGYPCVVVVTDAGHDAAVDAGPDAADGSADGAVTDAAADATGDATGE